jgi:hypothetical protein
MKSLNTMFNNPYMWEKNNLILQVNIKNSTKIQGKGDKK